MFYLHRFKHLLHSEHVPAFGMLHLPHFPKPSFAYYVFVVELAPLDRLFGELIFLFLERCFNSHRLILRNIDEVVDNGLVHKTFYYTILARSG
jgi:hypothetical protein